MHGIDGRAIDTGVALLLCAELVTAAHNDQPASKRVLKAKTRALDIDVATGEAVGN